MTTLVLSNHVPAIEQALIAAGQPVIVAMTKKHARLRSPGGRFPYPVVTVSDWDAFGELNRIAHDLRSTVTHVATVGKGQSRQRDSCAISSTCLVSRSRNRLGMWTRR